MKLKLENLMGRKALFRIKVRGSNNDAAISFPVVITHAKIACGSVNVRVRPLDGRGSAWVRRSAVRLVRQQPVTAVMKRKMLDRIDQCFAAAIEG